VIKTLSRILLIALTLFTSAPINSRAAPRSVSVSFGLFRFNATDYYYPNFYEEAGYRSEVAYTWGEVNVHAGRFQLYGYPGDDNIFETILEYGYHRKMTVGGWEVIARPVAGLAVVKLQYPAPYYPTVEHQYLPWLRAGYDASIGHKLTGPIFVRGGDRGRLLYYLGSSYAGFAEDKAEWQNGPFGEVEITVAPRWKLIGRGGVEVGGYYDDVFLTREKKLRPYGEAGFGYAF
jgi:hypothetical protein